MVCKVIRGRRVTDAIPTRTHARMRCIRATFSTSPRVIKGTIHSVIVMQTQPRRRDYRRANDILAINGDVRESVRTVKGHGGTRANRDSRVLFAPTPNFGSASLDRGKPRLFASVSLAAIYIRFDRLWIVERSARRSYDLPMLLNRFRRADRRLTYDYYSTPSRIIKSRGFPKRRVP